MIALFRLLVLALVVLTGVYFLVSIYARSVRRETLEKRWDASPPNSGNVAADAEARDAYLEAGMKDYDQSLRRRLIWLVYVVPLAVMVVTVYMINAQ